MFPWNMFSFNKDDQHRLQKMKPDEINKYVQDLMEKMVPAGLKDMMNPFEFMHGFQSPNGTQPSTSEKRVDILRSTIFETHDYVFVRIPINNETWLKEMAIYHTSNQLIVEHIPKYEDKHTITLPAIVKKKGSSANYKDGMLEVRIPKNIDMQFSQIDVTEMS